MKPSIVSVVLAAGESQRFGRNKLNEPINDVPLIIRALALCEDSQQTFVVTGAFDADIRSILQQFEVKADVIFNPAWKEGIGSSLSCAFQVLPDADGAMVLLGDQPLLQQVDIDRLQSAFSQNRQKIICAEFQQTVGPPAIFPKASWQKLERLTGHIGAKNLLKDKNHTISIPIAAAAYDVDTEEDLAKAAIRHCCAGPEQNALKKN